MQIQISGQHISTGNALQEYATEKVTNIVSRYFAEAPSSHIHFSKQNRDYTCDIVVNEGTGRHVVIKSNAHCDDIYSAFDLAASKLEKQLRRYKAKLENHSKQIKVSQITPNAIKYVIAKHDLNNDQELELGSPAIIAEKPTPIMAMSVSQAVMKMDLENLPALMFENSKSGRINVVYYRKDGNISWVDSQ